MTKNRLNIMKEEKEPSFFSEPSQQMIKRKEEEAKFERLWLKDPEQFNPLRSCLEKERLTRSWELLTKSVSLKDKKVVDLGCGSGYFSRQLAQAEAIVDAVDIAENALKVFRQEGAEKIHLIQDAMPRTQLPDHTYDIVVCTDLIAYLPKEDYRLFFAELARLLKPDGILLCSTPIDIDTTGGVEKFLSLLRTEFEIKETSLSYNAFYLKFSRFFRWMRGIFEKKIVMLKMEKICRFFSSHDGISHIAVIAKVRPFNPPQPEDIPIDRPRKREIWT